MIDPDELNGHHLNPLLLLRQSHARGNQLFTVVHDLVVGNTLQLECSRLISMDDSASVQPDKPRPIRLDEPMRLCIWARSRAAQPGSSLCQHDFCSPPPITLGAVPRLGSDR